jgi:hypothetical protein
MTYTIAVLLTSLLALLEVYRAVVAVFVPPPFTSSPGLVHVLAVHVAYPMIFVLPVVLVWQRWLCHRANLRYFLPPRFKDARRLGYRVGTVFIWIGHCAAVFYLGRIALFAIPASRMIGGGTLSYWITLLASNLSVAAILYWLGIFCVEVSVRRWRKKEFS